MTHSKSKFHKHHEKWMAEKSVLCRSAFFVLFEERAGVQLHTPIKSWFSITRIIRAGRNSIGYKRNVALKMKGKLHKSASCKVLSPQRLQRLEIKLGSATLKALLSPTLY